MMSGVVGGCVAAAAGGSLSSAARVTVLVGAARERCRVECPERAERPEPTDAAPDMGALDADPRGVVVAPSCIG